MNLINIFNLSTNATAIALKISMYSKKERGKFTNINSIKYDKKLHILLSTFIKKNGFKKN